MTFLETNRLRLRNVSPKDAIQMVDYRNNERCSKYQRGQTKDYKDIVALIERNKDNALNIASPTMISVALRETDAIRASVPAHTVAIEEEPFDSRISETTRTQYG